MLLDPDGAYTFKKSPLIMETINRAREAEQRRYEAEQRQREANERREAAELWDRQHSQPCNE